MFEKSLHCCRNRSSRIILLVTIAITLGNFRATFVATTLRDKLNKTLPCSVKKFSSFFSDLLWGTSLILKSCSSCHKKGSRRFWATRPVRNNCGSLFTPKAKHKQRLRLPLKTKDDTEWLRNYWTALIRFFHDNDQTVVWFAGLFGWTYPVKTSVAFSFGCSRDQTRSSLDPFRTSFRTVPCEQKADQVQCSNWIPLELVPCKHSLRRHLISYCDSYGRSPRRIFGHDIII